MNIIQSFKNLFSQTSFQYGTPQLARINQEETVPITSEINEMLRKDAIQHVKAKPGEFMSNLFSGNKNDGSHRPVMNLKFLNSFILHTAFQNRIGICNKESSSGKRPFDKDRSKRCLY